MKTKLMSNNAPDPNKTIQLWRGKLSTCNGNSKAYDLKERNNDTEKFRLVQSITIYYLFIEAIVDSYAIVFHVFDIHTTLFFIFLIAGYPTSN